MKLSVVILNYNVRYFLQQCILSVQEALAAIDSEIIVVDNASSDDSCAMVRKFFPEVILLENKENVGFSKANNQGVAIANGKYVCILNPDTAVAKDTFLKTLAFAEAHPEMGALGVKLVDGTGAFLPESKRNLPIPKVALFKMLGIPSKKNSYYAINIKENSVGKVAVLVGAFMLMEKKKYEQVNGFDEAYFMYGEDIDLSYKLEKAGFTNYYFGETAVLHYKGESTNKDKEYLRRFYGAMRIFYNKHFHTSVVFKAVITLGIIAARTGNFFKLKKSKKSTPPKTYFLLSDNITFLKKLSDTMPVALKSISKQAVTDGGIYDSQLIFDANYISYSKIIQTMEALQNKGNTFRIRPIHADFILGSDKSTHKGEVFKIG